MTVGLGFIERRALRETLNSAVESFLIERFALIVNFRLMRLRPDDAGDTLIDSVSLSRRSRESLFNLSLCV